MNWTNAADLLFPAGALLAAGLVAYGGWLYITAPQAHPRKAPRDARTYEATPLPPRPWGAARRERKGATLDGAMDAWVASGVLVLMILASTGYVVFRGTYEVVLLPEATTSMAAVAANPADAGDAPRKDNASSGPATPADY